VSEPKRILAVALDQENLARVGPFLERSDLGVELVERASEAARLAVRQRFDLVICRYPLPDLKLKDLVATIRGRGSASRRCSLMLLTIPEMLAEAASGVSGGPFLVLSGEEAPSAIGEGAARLLEVAPRHAPRIRARLRVSVDETRDPFVGWVVNLSTSGMLVADAPMLPVGGRCLFEFTLPGGEPVRGAAVVVRHAAPRREKVTGFALRFLEFEADGREILERWCRGDGSHG
jgi:CheY-like chemotaxis protein